MTEIAKLLSCARLFELSERGAHLPSELLSFLENAGVPWKALGENLARFVESRVRQIPAEQRIRGRVSPHATIENHELVYIGEGAVVEAGAYISGPAWIEPGAEVRHCAYVRGPAIVCCGAVAGHTTEIKGSILLPRAKASHFAYVGDSLLGFDVNLGAGTKLANLRFDHALVLIRTGVGAGLETGLKKLGGILGNRAQTGCNSVMNPGTVLLPEASILPCQTAGGLVQPHK